MNPSPICFSVENVDVSVITMQPALHNIHSSDKYNQLQTGIISIWEQTDIMKFSSEFAIWDHLSIERDHAN